MFETTNLLSVAVLLGSLGVVFVPNLVYSAFLLALTCTCLSGIFLCFNAEFIAISQVLIYVGAINVLLVFAIMLINDTKISYTVFDWKNCLIFGIIAFVLIAGILKTQWITPPFIPELQTTNILGGHLFNDFLLPFELVSVLLLIALIGTVVLVQQQKIS